MELCCRKIWEFDLGEAEVGSPDEKLVNAVELVNDEELVNGEGCMSESSCWYEDPFIIVGPFYCEKKEIIG